MIQENKNSLLIDKLNELIDRQILNNKKIVLFGLNTSSYLIKKHLERKGLQVFAYIDNNQKKVIEKRDFLMYVMKQHILQDEFNNLQIAYPYTPGELLTKFDDDYIFLIASKYYPSMLAQLESYGYKENKHIFKVLDFYGIEEILEKNDINPELRELSVSEIRKVQMEIAQYVQHICEENHLNVYIDGGTLIGAVRHKGYIPWDDDIDMVSPLPDYKKLIDILVKDGRYEIDCLYSNPDTCSKFYANIIDRNTVLKLWDYPYLTTTGISIDLFPMMGVPDDLMERNVYYNHIRMLKESYVESWLDTDASEEDIQRRKEIQEELIVLMEKYDFYESATIGYVFSKYWEKQLVDRSNYNVTVKLPFEDTYFNAPEGYDAILRHVFGDYMQLPDEKNRYTTHNYKVWGNSVV